MKANRTYIDNLVNGLTTDKIKFKEGNGWFTNIQKKEVTYNPQDILNLPHITAKGLLLHETGHCKYTTDTETTKLEKEYPEAMHNIYNAFEDIRIEEKLGQEYGDFANEAISHINLWGMKTARARIEKGEASPLSQVMLGILAHNTHTARYTSSEIRAKTTTEANALYDNLPSEIQEKITKIVNIPMIRYVKQCTDTVEVKNTIDHLVYPILEDYIKKEPKNAQTASLAPQHGTIHNLNAKEVPQTTELPQDNELKHLLSPYINTLSKKLATILQEKKATKYSGSYKSGKLLSKNSYKVLTNSTRIFSKKNNPNNPDYEVTFILDESGSMMGNKHELTYLASFLLNETCKKLGFKTNCIVYNSKARIAELESYRRMRGGGNNDHLAFVEAQKLLNPQKDNIIFILTDGGVCSDPRIIIDKLRKQGVIIVAVGVGLGIEDSKDLRKYYPIAVSVPEVEQLPNVMIAQMQKIIHR